MRNLIVLSVMLSIVSYAKEPTPLDDWAIEKQGALFENCSVSRKQWIARYREVEVQWNEKLAELGELSAKARMKNVEFFRFAKIVFPQDLPAEFPLKGAYLACFDYFVAMKEAKTPSAIATAISDLIECEEESYRTERPELLNRYISCLKQVKKD